jgi:hypothetical protein
MGLTSGIVMLGLNVDAELNNCKWDQSFLSVLLGYSCNQLYFQRWPFGIYG